MRKRFAVLCPGVCRAMLLGAAAMLWWCHEASGAVAADAAHVATNAFHFVDLARVAGPLSAEGSLARQFTVLPSGLQAFHRVAFLLGDRVALAGTDSARNGELYPGEVIGIQVGRKAKRLHLLLGALFADKDGAPMVKLIWHYAGGAQDSLRLGYGVQMRNWMKPRLERRSGLVDPNSQIAWTDSDPNERSESRLFQTALENPRPDEVITSIDLVSLFSQATPIIFAISTEDGDSGLPANRRVPPKKTIRELHEFSDSVYRREFLVRTTDSQDGRPLTNAVASLTVTDDGQTYYFGEASADAAGVCRVAYPPRQTVGFNLLVRARNHIPLVISESKTNRAEFSPEFTAPLQRGVAVGGVVKNPEGKPIPGVEVLVHRVVKTGAREYTRTDYDTAVTDTNGVWSSSSLPAGFAAFSFQLAHPDYKPALYVMPGYAEGQTNKPAASPARGASYRRLDDGSLVALQTPAATRTGRPGTARTPAVLLVTSNALLSAAAEMTLQPAILVSGTVLGSEGKAIPGTDLIFQRNSPAYERKHLKAESNGHFRVMVAEPGDAALFVIRSGQTPTCQPLNIEPGMAPIEIKVAPARVLRGRVIDRQQRPVPGAKIRLDEWQGTADLLHFQTLTDEQGRFTWTGAPPDQVTFYLSKSNYYNMRQQFSLSTAEMTLSLNRWPGVSGNVYDADTKKPIDSFSIIKGRKYSQNDTQAHWDRYDTARGRNGEYTTRMNDYYFQPEARIMVEAPGYIPQISPGWTNADSYTNDFALKKGKGISGVVQKTDGTPAPNATLLLVDKSESGYMDTPGQFRNGSSGGDFTRSDAKGHFEFSPMLEADMILVAHEQGYAEVKAEKAASAGQIVLQPWGRVKGVMRVGDKPGPDKTVRLQNRYDRFYEPGHRSSALSLYLKNEPDEAGNFVFEKVPAGDRRVCIEYGFKENNNGETPLSHALPISVKPGQTTEVMLGGTGRSLVGRVKVTGGEQSDVDWKRDVHKLTLMVPSEAITPPNMTGVTTPEEQQKAWAEFNKRQREFWQSEAGRARDLAERTYVLLFDTNGNFHIDNVPAGRYNLQLNPSDPEEEYYRQRPIGNLSKEVVVPDEPGAKVNQPFDLGTVELKIQPQVKIGKLVPPFEGKTLEGKPIQLSDFRGKPVLLYFWVSGAVDTFDLQILKELHNTYGKEGKLVVLGMNLDADARAAEQFAKAQGMIWPHVHLGQWGQTQVPTMFGVDGYPIGVLVDGAGKLAARQLRGSALRNAAHNVLAMDPAIMAKP